jgi:hypothetical protein
MPLLPTPSHRFDRYEETAFMAWDPHVTYPALTPVARLEAVGFGPAQSGSWRTGELPGQGWNGQSFADNPSPADLLRLGSRVPTAADGLLRNVVM